MASESTPKEVSHTKKDPNRIQSVFTGTHLKTQRVIEKKGCNITYHLRRNPDREEQFSRIPFHSLHGSLCSLSLFSFPASHQASFSSRNKWREIWTYDHVSS